MAPAREAPACTAARGLPWLLAMKLNLPSCLGPREPRARTGTGGGHAAAAPSPGVQDGGGRPSAVRDRGGRPSAVRDRRGRCGSSRRLLVLLLLLAVTAACAGPEIDTAGLAALEIPPEYAEGAALYEVWCMACHGPQATGTDAAPPLVHPIYRTRHHGDEAFQLAVAQGVRAHHFRFGDMPAIPGPDRDDVAAITAYVRWLQREAGID
jgi:mono/diheme cytochrome c family protein